MSSFTIVCSFIFHQQFTQIATSKLACMSFMTKYKKIGNILTKSLVSTSRICSEIPGTTDMPHVKHDQS